MSEAKQFNFKKPLKIVVFVGGSGTRMWPMSRKSNPKQFQSLVGERSMFQQMIDHLLSGYSADDIFISTSPDYVDNVRTQAPMLHPEHIITEPELRDTAAAVGFAAVHVAHKFPGSLMLTVWGGDHLVSDRKAFIDSLHTAHRLAEDKGLTVQVNVRPTFPSTALGYTEIGDQAHQEYGENIYTFVRQVEKPDLPTAKHFLRSVKYLWHTGYRVWDIDTLLNLYKKHAPASYEALMAIAKELEQHASTDIIASEYSKIEKKSIDYAVYVHVGAEGQAVIAADLGWNDIGTWQVLKDELSEHSKDNVTQGENILLETAGSLVYTNKNKITAVIGMDDIVVVHTDDAVLVMPKERAADIKQVIEELKARGLEKFL